MFKVKDLKYSYDALEPYFDAQTMEIHHSKHVLAYVTNLNAAIEKHPEYFNWPVNDILADIENIPADIKQAVINHGGGVSNHEIFFDNLTPNQNPMSDELKEAFIKNFGSFESFKEAFENAAKTRFGSGWAFLVTDEDNKLSVISTANQDSPIMNGYKILLALDVWEHAYYLKFQNRRPDYISEFWNVVDWDVVLDRLGCTNCKCGTCND